MNNLPQNWHKKTVKIAIDAGKKIMAIYSQAFDVEDKDDGSPLTQADKDSHYYIVDSLRELAPHVPVISEESYQPGSGRCGQDVYWLVDPLDGTKEFIKRNGEFTVNIALMQNNKPIWGVVHAPVMELTYFGGPDHPSIKRSPQRECSITVNRQISSHCTLVVSRSHLSRKTKALFSTLKQAGIVFDTVASGSSLKFCMIADGQADCYPRLGLTSEWDTAAAQAVLAGAGGEVLRLKDGLALDYNKSSILNPEFIACSKLNKLTKKTIFQWYQNV